MKTQSSPSRPERGEGNVGNIVKLAIFALLGLAAFNAGPVFFANYSFKDRLTEIAGGFPPNTDGDARARVAVEAAIAEAGLGKYLTMENCSVTSGGGIGGERTVSCIYEREYKLLPGMSPRKHRFENVVSRPMF